MERSHKIPGVTKAICNCEQKIAYNYCFGYRDLRDDGTDHMLSLIKKDLFRREDMKKYNRDLIWNYITQNYNRYIDEYFIANSYEQIGEFFRLEEKTA